MMPTAPRHDSGSAGRTYGGSNALQRAQARRRRLIDATLLVIAESGVTAVNAETVCRRARVAKRYFYEIFTDKDDLLLICADELYARLQDAVQSALATMPAAQRIRALPKAVVHTLASDPAAARLYAESAAFPRLRARQQQAIQDFSISIPGESAENAQSVSRPTGARRDLVAWILTAGSTDAIIAWLLGEIACDEDTLVTTIATLAASAALTE